MKEQEKSPTKLELSVELIKAITWPSIVLFILISFWSPLQKTANLIPSLLNRSDVVTIAGLSLQVGKDLQARSSEDVEKVLSRLSPDGIKQVLSLSDTAFWDKDSVNFAKKETKELIELGLVKEIDYKALLAENTRSHSDHGYGIEATDLGYRTQNFLRLVISKFIKQLSEHPEN